MFKYSLAIKCKFNAIYCRHILAVTNNAGYRKLLIICTWIGIC
ncbi:SWIM zinc finger family protein [Pseudoalteromonas sp. SWXJZ94C]|nr:SWIM zinc finger family protein [Pseudoalteromonas sp. SWXJZ94C]